MSMETSWDSMVGLCEPMGWLRKCMGRPWGGAWGSMGVAFKVHDEVFEVLSKLIGLSGIIMRRFVGVSGDGLGKNGY